MLISLDASLFCLSNVCLPGAVDFIFPTIAERGRTFLVTEGVVDLKVHF